MAIVNSGTANLSSSSTPIQIAVSQANSGNTKDCNSNIPVTDATRHRKHRVTILIGYGEEAGCVLKRCEQLKFRLGIGTNIQFLTFLIEFFEERNTEYRSKINTEPSVSKYAFGSFPSYIYDVKFKTFNTPAPDKISTQNIENKNNNSALSIAVSTSSNYGEEQKQQKVLQGPLNPIINQHNEVVEKQIADKQNENAAESIQNSSELPSESMDDTTHERDVFTSITPAKRKSHIDTDYENTGSSITEKPATSVSSSGQQLHQGVDAPAIKPVEIATSLTLSTLNIKALKLIHQYMENIKNDLSYYHGYISSSEKLKCFLHDYRVATYTSFTVRSSRSYIKKRALNALKAVKNENCEVPTVNGIKINNMDSDQIVNQNNENHIMDAIKSSNNMTLSNVVGMRKRTDNSCDVVSSDDVQNVIDDESMLTGPLRWEFILGKPPIPFTGVPFFIIGNTQYQCYYATADIRTQRRKEKIAKILQENPGVKTRMRRSMKRDCKAVMCIKSIVTFPEFSVVDKLASVKSKKGCRKLKATTLDNLRDVVEKGEYIGHPAFWIHIPLPEAHSTHDILGSSEVVTEHNNMDEIAHILELAAQYGGQLEIAHEGDENIAHLKINNTNEQLQNNQPVNRSLDTSNKILCVNNPHTTHLDPQVTPAVSRTS